MRGTLRIGVATVVPELNAITSADRQAEVRPKSMDVLVCLAGRAGEVVSREEILTAVWGDVAVSPDTLTQTIVELRKAFGDSAREPRIIQTIPRRGYRLLPAVRREAADEAAPIRSLAVLPLKNHSGDPRQDSLAEGLTDEVITALAKIRALRVISHHSVSCYRGRTMAIPAIARDLNVDAVIEGSIVVAGGRVRIHLQLIRPDPERHVWAEVFEGDRNALMMLQGDMVRAVAQQLSITLGPREQARLEAPAHTISREAHDAFLWGRHHFSKWNRDGLLKARAFFEQAGTIEPGYGAAHAWIALCYTLLGYFNHLPRDVACSRAKTAASTSVALDDELGEAHLAIGVLQAIEGDWLASERAYRRALLLAPSSPWTHWGYAVLLAALGRHEEAIAEMERACELDPLNPYMHTSVGEMYWFAERPVEALERYRRTLALEPGFARAWDLIVMLYESRRVYPEAIEARRQRARAAGRADDAEQFAHAYESSGERGYLRLLLARLSAGDGAVNPRGGHEPRVPRTAVLAGIHARLGETDRALALLESEFEFLAMTHPDYASLRGNPRFEALLRRVGLSPRGHPRHQHG